MSFIIFAATERLNKLYGAISFKDRRTNQVTNHAPPLGSGSESFPVRMLRGFFKVVRYSELAGRDGVLDEV
jgi:hypothetical protein